jgi:hypothetical protein
VGPAAAAAVEKKEVAVHNQRARGTGGLIVCRRCMMGSGDDRRSAGGCGSADASQLSN